MNSRIKLGLVMGFVWSLALIESTPLFNPSLSWFPFAIFITGMVSGLELILFSLDHELRKNYGFGLNELEKHLKEVD